MSDIKNLQNSLHGHSITAINAFQTAKVLLTVTLKDELPEHQRKMLQADLRRLDHIIDQVLCLEVMDDYYRLERNQS